MFFQLSLSKLIPLADYASRVNICTARLQCPMHESASTSTLTGLALKTNGRLIIAGSGYNL